MNPLLHSAPSQSDTPVRCGSMGYYILPPGYVESKDKSVFGQKDRPSTLEYQSCGTWTGSTMTDSEKSTASDWVDNRESF